MLSVFPSRSFGGAGPLHDPRGAVKGSVRIHARIAAYIAGHEGREKHELFMRKGVCYLFSPKSDREDSTMNTRQLTALWYIALLLAASAVAIGLAAQKNDWPNDWRPFTGIAGAIAILGGTLIFTLSEHPNAQPKRLWKTVALPLASIAVVAGAILMWHLGSFRQIQQEPQEAVDTELPFAELAKLEGNAKIHSDGDLSCTVYNASSWTVKEIIVHVDVSPSTLTDTDFSADQVQPPQSTPSKSGPLTFDDIAPPSSVTGSSVGHFVPDSYAKTPGDIFDKIAAATPSPGSVVHDRVLISRDFRMSPGYYSDPLETTIFGTFAGIELAPNQHWTWKIVSAQGHPK
ncbi:MAG: hypothetical protein ABSE62_15855 [Chthoniobacteraceae bacterium]|jgi:hypothetical protein